MRWVIATASVLAAIAWGWHRFYGDGSERTKLIGDAPWCTVTAFERELHCRYYSEIHCVKFGLPDNDETFCVSRPR